MFAWAMLVEPHASPMHMGLKHKGNEFFPLHPIHTLHPVSRSSGCFPLCVLQHFRLVEAPVSELHKPNPKYLT